MNKKHTQEQELSFHMKTLRMRAELKTPPLNDMNFSAMSSDEIASLVHELETHQIELEMQNRDLISTQAVLVELRDEYTQLYESAPIGYLTIAPEGHIIKSNKTFSKMLERPESMIKNKKLSAFIVNEDQDIYYKHQLNTLDSRLKQSCELRLKTESEQPLWVAIESICTFNAHGNDGTIIQSALMDITERKKAEEALATADKQSGLADQAKLIFLDTMTHDIRTPVNGVKQITSLLLESKLDPRQKQYVETIDDTIQSLVAIPDDRLD